jgi:hypothetical protein
MTLVSAGAFLVYAVLVFTRPSPHHPVTRVKQEPYAPQVAQIPITQSPRTASGSFDSASRGKLCYGLCITNYVLVLGPLPSIKKEREPETDEGKHSHFR